MAETLKTGHLRKLLTDPAFLSLIKSRAKPSGEAAEPTAQMFGKVYPEILRPDDRRYPAPKKGVDLPGVADPIATIHDGDEDGEKTVSQVRASPAYVDNGIKTLIGEIDNPFDLNIVTMKIIYADGRRLLVPFDSIVNTNHRTTNFLRHGKFLFPIDNSGILYDADNTPNIVRCKLLLWEERKRVTAERLRIAEIVVAFSGAVATSGQAAGGLPSVPGSTPVTRGGSGLPRVGGTRSGGGTEGGSGGGNKPAGTVAPPSPSKPPEQPHPQQQHQQEQPASLPRPQEKQHQQVGVRFRDPQEQPPPLPPRQRQQQQAQQQQQTKTPQQPAKPEQPAKPTGGDSGTPSGGSGSTKPTGGTPGGGSENPPGGGVGKGGRGNSGGLKGGGGSGKSVLSADKLANRPEASEQVKRANQEPRFLSESEKKQAQQIASVLDEVNSGKKKPEDALNSLRQNPTYRLKEPGEMSAPYAEYYETTLVGPEASGGRASLMRLLFKYDATTLKFWGTKIVQMHPQPAP